MANYNKSFNFRNGVQVDTDKFIVNTAGLVGIGSTIPSDYLDVNASSSSLPNRGISVRGSIKATGLVTSSELYVSGITTFLGNVGIGTTNIDAAADSNNTKILNAGIVTANFYYGSGLYLSDVIGFSTEAWNVVDPEGASVGSRTGLTTTSRIGIGTTLANESYDLIIGSNPSITGNQGISFKGSTGKIHSTGTIEADYFDGDVIAGIITGTIAVGSSEQGNITSLGTLTALDVGGHTELDNVNVSGFSTFAGITTSTHTLFTKQLSTSGISTFSGITTSISTLFTKELSASGFSTFNDNVGVADTIFHIGDDNTIIRFPENDHISFETAGTEALHINENQKVGLGTTNPTADFQIRRYEEDTDATLQVISKEKTAIVAVGDSESLTGHTGQFRYGHTTGNFTYSNEISLDIINYSRGSINNILNPNLQTGIGTGDFNWIVGESVAPKMTLTYDGSLGIGKTLPDHKLHVVGTSTFSSHVNVGGDLVVGGNCDIDGTVSFGDTVTTSVKGNIIAHDDTILFNIGAPEDAEEGITGDGTDSILTVGFVTAYTSVTTNSGTFNNAVGIVTSPDVLVPLKINDDPGERVFVDDSGNIGVKTDLDYGVTVAIPDGTVIVGDSVGIGTTTTTCALDVGVGGTETTRFMIPPKVDNAGRTGLSTNIGALIYNTQTNKLNLYIGDNEWVAISTEAI